MENIKEWDFKSANQTLVLFDKVNELIREVNLIKKNLEEENKK